MKLFQTQHPIFGTEHPTAEEAYRLGHEWGTRTKKERKTNLTTKAQTATATNGLKCPECNRTFDRLQALGKHRFSATWSPRPIQSRKAALGSEDGARTRQASSVS